MDCYWPCVRVVCWITRPVSSELSPVFAEEDSKNDGGGDDEDGFFACQALVVPRAGGGGPPVKSDLDVRCCCGGIYLLQ